jgi:SAM-dependent methyltransferase
MNPPDVLGASLLRLPRAWIDALATAAVGLRSASDEAVELRARPVVPDADAEPPFEPRRDTCAWCGARSLEPLLEVPDLLQQKPGTYHLDECQSCGHVFQNPQLAPAGLDHIYQDAYHGLGGEMAELMQAKCAEAYWGRANAVARFTEPARWLDVGSSYGHFFLAARRLFPKTTFDAVDMGDAVDEGHRRGWIDHVHQGFFLDLVDGLPTYDVVSMHHYLEHTRDPLEELAAVKKVLEPGGYLMIELPDQENPWARRLGRYWWQWGQPQHLNFMPCDNLVAELETMGFEVLSVERGGPSFGNDLTVGLLFWAQSVSRSTLAPWLPPPTLAERVRRAATVGAVLPALVVAQIVDRVDLAQVKKNDSVSNVYRVVARRSDQAEPADQ